MPASFRPASLFWRGSSTRALAAIEVHTDQDELDDAEIARRIRSLQRQLDEPDLERRREAAKAIYELCYSVGSRAAAAIPALVSCIGDLDDEIGDSGAWGLAYCSPLSIEPLIGCLTGGTSAARRRACSALGNIGSEAFPAAKALRELLADSAIEVRERAAWALGLIRDTGDGTINALFAMARAAMPSERSAALHALGNIGQSLVEPKALQAKEAEILRALADENEDVRWSGCYVAGSLRLAAPAHARLLVQLLRNENSSRVRSMAISQLKELVPSVELTHYLPTMSDVIRRGEPDAGEMCECIALMGSRASAAAPALLEALDGEGGLALRAAEALWKVNGRADQLLPVLGRLFEDYGESVCDVICELGPAAGPLVDQVIAALQSEDWDLQWAAADALGAIASEDPKVLSALTGALGHPSPIMKSAAAKALAKVGPSALLDLVRILTDATDARSEWAADAVGRMGYQAASAAEDLRSALRDGRSGVAAWSAIALAKVAGDPTAVPRLIELLAMTDRPDLQREAAIGLAAVGPAARDALPALKAALDDPDPEVQAAVAEAITAIGAQSN